MEISKKYFRVEYIFLVNLLDKIKKTIRIFLVVFFCLLNLVTSIFNLTQGFHKDKIDNIIKERKSWREKIRAIASNLEKARSYYEIRGYLEELKVRLNAYGIGLKDNNDVKYYKIDAHIWRIIENIEKNKNSLNENKKLLIEYLSLLLKHDWERSKNEIFGNIKIYAFDVVFWIGFIVLLFTYSWFYNSQLNGIEQYKGWHIFGLFFVLHLDCIFIINELAKICFCIKKRMVLKSSLLPMEKNFL